MVGQNLPNLTYMLAFDDLASRERLWRVSAPIRSGRSCACSPD